MSRLNCPAACGILRIRPQLEGPKTYKIAPYLRPARPMRRYAGSYAGLGVCGWGGHNPARSGCPRRPPRVDSHRATVYPAQKPREPTNDRNKTLKSRVCSKDVSWLGHMARADRKTVSIDTRPTEPSLHLAFDGRSNRYRDAT